MSGSSLWFKLLWVWVCEEVPHVDFDDGNTVLKEEEEDDPGDAKDGAVCADNALNVEVEDEGDLELELEVELDFELDLRELLTDSGCL